MNQPELYIGLLSGTSIDAIDVAVFSISTNVELKSPDHDRLEQSNSVHNIGLSSCLSYEIPLDLKMKLNQITTQ